MLRAGGPRLAPACAADPVKTLSHTVVIGRGTSTRPTGTLYTLHGFLGSGRNWTSIARHLVELRPDWRVVLVDLRLHGDSRGLPAPHNLVSCAEDIVRLNDRLDWSDQPTCLLGHSFGGKVALAAAPILRPPPLQIWVIDSTPAPSRSQGSSAKMLQLLARSPARFADRDEAIAWVRAGGFDESTARWMAMNLQRREGDWAWQLDVSGLQDLLADFARADLWAIVESAPPGTDVRFVQAEHDSILGEAHERLERLEARGEAVHVSRLPGGQWLHIDNPDGLVALLAAELPRV